MKGNESDRTYSFLFDAFRKEVIEDRYNWLYSLIVNYLETEHADEFTHVSEEILRHVIIDYYVDIRRLKDFHDIEHTNRIKIYAYTSYWLLRHKPIQLKPDSPEEYWSINESFVAELLRSFLFDNPPNIPILKESEKSITDFLETMIYYFKYRDFSAKDIEILILAFNAGRGYQYSVEHQY